MASLRHNELKMIYNEPLPRPKRFLPFIDLGLALNAKTEPQLVEFQTKIDLITKFNELSQDIWSNGQFIQLQQKQPEHRETVPCFNTKTVFPSMGIPITKIRLSWEFLETSII